MDGQTLSKEPSSGAAEDWILKIKNRSDVVIRDTWWDNGERDLRTLIPSQLPTMPRPLVKLHERRRAGVYLTADGHTWMTAWIVVPRESDGWPLFRHVTSLDALDAACGHDLLRAASEQGIADIATKWDLLKDDGRNRNELCALFEPKADGAHVAFYAVTRVVPILRHVGWM
ncbi:hypothetical protein DDQ41_12500 [Streptomyces spongiicola]|uniref:Uncharacterized protein n=1 Tax=Streptomyces spongiicola TaxID=1690221 RepID=A0ABM6V662_9ACTN|nr:hypothetical protein [Streptomyces spongiicola]AWK09606.1 hypothetical protein DDQ41_12500 [Streptomyces spongiicola]